MGPTLRASCDTCNQAKVKCTKQSPRCTRCKKNGIDCIYGVSLRAGKRPSQQVELPRKVESPPPLPTDWNMDINMTTPYSPLEMDHCPSMFEYDMSFPLDGYQGNGFFSNEEGFPPMPDLSFSDRQHERPASVTTNASTTNTSPVMSDSVLSIPTDIPQTSHPQKLPSTTKFASCICFRTIVFTLSTLQQLSESSHTSLDVALVHNKEPVSLCLSILRCNCAFDSTIVLLVSSLLAKIIDIYQRPCGVWKAVEHRKPSHDSIVATTRLTLGSYNIDERDEERLKTEIVRLELRKMVIILRDPAYMPIILR
jgi:hypothetical protein